jgi:hypothetical protein
MSVSGTTMTFIGGALVALGIFLCIVAFIVITNNTQVTQEQNSAPRQSTVKINPSVSVKLTVGGQTQDIDKDDLSKSIVVQRGDNVMVTFSDGKKIFKTLDDPNITTLFIIPRGVYTDTECIPKFGIRYIYAPPEDVKWYVINKGDDEEQLVNEKDEYGNNLSLDAQNKLQAFEGQVWIAKNAYTLAELGRIKVKRHDLPVIVLEKDQPLKLSAI